MKLDGSVYRRSVRSGTVTENRFDKSMSDIFIKTDLHLLNVPVFDNDGIVAWAQQLRSQLLSGDGWGFGVDEGLQLSVFPQGQAGEQIVGDGDDHVMLSFSLSYTGRRNVRSVKYLSATRLGWLSSAAANKKTH